MSRIAKFAWFIQIDIFVLLFILVPRGPWRLPTLLSYILTSTALVIWVRRPSRQ